MGEEGRVTDRASYVFVVVKRWRLHGPNRSTGLGQLTAGQSGGTRRHAALTADPSWADRLYSPLYPLSNTYTQTRFSTSVLPTILPRLTRTSRDQPDESDSPLPLHLFIPTVRSYVSLLQRPDVGPSINSRRFDGSSRTGEFRRHVPFLPFCHLIFMIVRINYDLTLWGQSLHRVSLN